MFRRQRLAIGVLEDVKPFGIGLHQAVFDAVMDHLDKMPGADGAGVNIALLDPGIASLAPGGARDIADARRERGEDRIEPVDHRLVAADHHAIAPLDTPNAARGADAALIDGAIPPRLAASDVVLPHAAA